MNRRMELGVLLALVVTIAVIAGGVALRSAMKDDTKFVYDPDGACAVHCGTSVANGEDCEDIEGTAYNPTSGLCESTFGEERECEIGSHPIINSIASGGVACYPNDYNDNM